MSTPCAPAFAPYGALLLRLMSGVLFLTHAAIKLFVFTPSGTVAYFQSLGLPGPMAYGVIGLELVIGVALVLGVYGRWFALLGIPLLLGTIATVHGPAGFGFANPNGGWEYPAFWSIALLVQALIGDGALALRKGR